MEPTNAEVAIYAVYTVCAIILILGTLKLIVVDPPTETQKNPYMSKRPSWWARKRPKISAAMRRGTKRLWEKLLEYDGRDTLEW